MCIIKDILKLNLFLKLSLTRFHNPFAFQKNRRSEERQSLRRSPVVEALAHIMDVHNDGKEDEGRGGENDEEHDYQERGGDIRGR